MHCVQFDARTGHVGMVPVKGVFVTKELTKLQIMCQ